MMREVDGSRGFLDMSKVMILDINHEVFSTLGIIGRQGRGSFGVRLGGGVGDGGGRICVDAKDRQEICRQETILLEGNGCLIVRAA